MFVSALKRNRALCVSFVLLTLLASLSGCGPNPGTRVVVTPTALSPVPRAVPTPPFNGHVTIYEVAQQAQAPIADPNGLVPVAITVNAKTLDPAREAINALVSSDHTPIPHGTKLLSIVIDQPTGLATLNFSSEFKDNFTGGDTKEAQVLNSVLETMGQFPNVQNVQFLVAGEKIGTLGGTQDLTDPLPTIRDNKEAAAGG